jgi:hypothetical protein
MKTFVKFVFLLGLVFLAFTNLSFGQKLQLADILTVYKLDSISLKAFCEGRQFELVKVTEDNWIFSYTFQSKTDKKISLIRTFPKDHSDQIFLYYYFDDKKDYKNLKDSLKSNGFEKFRSYNIFPENPSMSDYREGFVTENLELELSTSNVESKHRALLLFKRSNFNKQ